MWSKDINLIPPVSHGDIVNYLVYGRSKYTFEQFKSYKSLEAHQQFPNGWVQDIETHKPANSDNFVIRSKVMHSQRLNEKMLQPWIILSPDGTVKSAHCNCMAGLAETCTHVGALLFKAEALVRVKERTTVTGEAAYWMIPGSINRVDPKEGCDIDFTTNEEKKKQLEATIESGLSPTEKRSLAPIKVMTPHPTQNELNFFFHGLKGTSAAILIILPGHCEDFKDPIKPVLLPRPLTSLRDPSCDHLSFTELLDHCKLVHQKYHRKIAADQWKNIEMLTKEQQNSPKWYSQRAGRVTASNLYSVCASDIKNPSQSTIKNVCYPCKGIGSVPAVKWGVRNEEKARNIYIECAVNKHKKLQIQKAGFCINKEFPYLGASPDGIIECECCGTGCLEIKCPFKFKYTQIAEAIKDPAFCLMTKGGKVYLKETHPYYFQIQTQMFVTKTDYCDFFVWTTADHITIRVQADVKFIEERKPKIEAFFYEVSLPELVAKYFTNAPKKDDSAVAENDFSLNPSDCKKQKQK